MDLIECRRFFERPQTSSQRQYEALRAYFIEGIASAEAAQRFGYTPAAFRMLCYDFRRGQLSDFFAIRRLVVNSRVLRVKLRTSATASVVGRTPTGRSSSRRRGNGAKPSSARISRTAVVPRGVPCSLSSREMSSSNCVCAAPRRQSGPYPFWVATVYQLGALAPPSR